MQSIDECAAASIHGGGRARDHFVHFYYNSLTIVCVSERLSACFWRVSGEGPAAALAAAAISAASFAHGIVRSLARGVARSRRRCGIAASSPQAGGVVRRQETSPAGVLRGTRCVGLLATFGVLSGCSSAPLVQGVGLSSYDAMTPSEDMLTKSRINVKKQEVLAAKTVRIVPTTFAPSVSPKLTDQQRALVANAVDRGLCVSLSDRLQVVPPDEPADLTVRASVTQATETNEVAAGISAAASIGMNFVDLAVPIPTPRLPIGLGNLSMEAEAVDAAGRQQASMLWAKGANALFSSPRVSAASDAYDLAEEFGGDFGHLLVKGESPLGSPGINLPSWQKINSAMGLPPKYAACESYGRYPGLAGVIGGQLGLPPEWTDSGAKQAAR